MVAGVWALVATALVRRALAAGVVAAVALGMFGASGLRASPVRPTRAVMPAARVVPTAAVASSQRRARHENGGKQRDENQTEA